MDFLRILSNKETFDQIADDFKFYKRKRIIIHNAPFDLGLNGELNLIKKKLIDKKLIVDSLEIARNKFPNTSNSLDALCKNLIMIFQKEKHSTLLDCELLKKFISIFLM